MEGYPICSWTVDSARTCSAPPRLLRMLTNLLQYLRTLNYKYCSGVCQENKLQPFGLLQCLDRRDCIDQSVIKLRKMVQNDTELPWAVWKDVKVPLTRLTNQVTNKRGLVLSCIQCRDVEMECSFTDQTSLLLPQAQSNVLERHTALPCKTLKTMQYRLHWMTWVDD